MSLVAEGEEGHPHLTGPILGLGERNRAQYFSVQPQSSPDLDPALAWDGTSRGLPGPAGDAFQQVNAVPSELAAPVSGPLITDPRAHGKAILDVVSPNEAMPLAAVEFADSFQGLLPLIAERVPQPAPKRGKPVSSFRRELCFGVAHSLRSHPLPKFHVVIAVDVIDRHGRRAVLLRVSHQAGKCALPPILDVAPRPGFEALQPKRSLG